MEKSEIMSRISYYHRQIDACERDIASLYRDIAALEEMSSCISQRKGMLISTQEEHIEKATRIGLSEINTKITTPYSEGIKRDLTGELFTNAQEGLNTALYLVENKIEEFRNEIQQKKWQISNWHETISRLYCELNTLSE